MAQFLMGIHTLFGGVARAAESMNIVYQFPGSSSSFSNPTDYISAVYKFGLGLVGIFGFGALVWGGVRYIVSGDNISKRVDARGQIRDAFIGILLLVSSVLILNEINPQILATTLQLQPAQAPSVSTNSSVSALPITFENGDTTTSIDQAIAAAADPNALNALYTRLGQNGQNYMLSQLSNSGVQDLLNTMSAVPGQNGLSSQDYLMRQLVLANSNGTSLLTDDQRAALYYNLSGDSANQVKVLNNFSAQNLTDFYNSRPIQGQENILSQLNSYNLLQLMTAYKKDSSNPNLYTNGAEPIVRQYLEPTTITFPNIGAHDERYAQLAALLSPADKNKLITDLKNGLYGGTAKDRAYILEGVNGGVGY